MRRGGACAHFRYRALARRRLGPVQVAALSALGRRLQCGQVKIQPRRCSLFLLLLPFRLRTSSRQRSSRSELYERPCNRILLRRFRLVCPVAPDAPKKKNHRIIPKPSQTRNRRCFHQRNARDVKGVMERVCVGGSLVLFTCGGARRGGRADAAFRPNLRCCCFHQVAVISKAEILLQIELLVHSHRTEDNMEEL
uniref:Uncharacterized protein n=1 Tax=Strigamia maritima TaxID=126957 RepID=T1JF84_STRMM